MAALPETRGSTMSINSDTMEIRVNEAVGALANDTALQREGRIDQAAGSIPRWGEALVPARDRQFGDMVDGAAEVGQMLVWHEPNGWDEV
jgi:hypothetical protein